MNKADRAEAARRAWETIRARKAAGVYAQPREPKQAKRAVVPVMERCEVGQRFWMRRVECRFENSRFVDGGVAVEMKSISPDAVAVAAQGLPSVGNVDRRQLQVPVLRGGEQWFAGPVK